MTDEALAAQADDNMPPMDEPATSVASPEEAQTESPETEEVATPEAGGFVEELDEAAQARVNKLTFEKHEQKRRADAAVKALEDYKANNAPPEQAEPKLEDFDFDDNAFNAASIKYQTAKAVNTAVGEYKTEQQQALDNQRQAEINNNFNARVDDFRKATPDYDQTIAGLPDLPGNVLDAVMQAENGPQLAHYLGKHLDVAESISLMKLGEISAQLKNVKPTNKQSAAPDPIEPVKSGGSLNKSMDDMSMDEIYALE